MIRIFLHGALLLAVVSLLVDHVCEHVHASALQFLAANDTAREEYFEHGIFRLCKQVVKLVSFCHCTCLDHGIGLFAVPDKDHVFELGSRAVAFLLLV